MSESRIFTVDTYNYDRDQDSPRLVTTSEQSQAIAEDWIADWCYDHAVLLKSAKRVRITIEVLDEETDGKS